MHAHMQLWLRGLNSGQHLARGSDRSGTVPASCTHCLRRCSDLGSTSRADPRPEPACRCLIRTPLSSNDMHASVLPPLLCVVLRVRRHQRPPRLHASVSELSGSAASLPSPTQTHVENNLEVHPSTRTMPHTDPHAFAPRMHLCTCTLRALLRHSTAVQPPGCVSEPSAPPWPQRAPRSTACACMRSYVTPRVPIPGLTTRAHACSCCW